MDGSISALDARCGDPQSALFLELIAQHIVDWEVLAPYFSLTEADQMAIKQDHSGQYQVQKRALLSTWIERNGNEATFSKMRKIFLQANCVNLADKLVEILQDVYSQSPDNAVAAFKLYLKDCYSTISPTATDRQNWPPLANTPYVEPELRLVVDSSPEWKPVRQPSRSIQCNDLFQDKDFPHKILLEGTAGSGKTTLSRNMCKEWEKGEFLSHMDLLIHLTLADPKVWSAQSLDGLIPHPSAEIRKAVANTIIERRGKKCCFVMDSWEDLPDDVPPYISDLVYGSKLGIALPHCSFIITTRPIASAPLKYSQAFTTVEITGFSSESIDTFATRYLKQQGEDPAVFITALHDNHHARGLCNLPINATILLYLFLTIGTGLPTTQTELFKCFIISILLRHLAAKQGQNPLRLRLTNFYSLPENERQLFDQLCRIAHFANFNTRSSSQSNQLLSRKELEEEGVRDLQETMGLMKVHLRLTCYGYEPYYGFLHSSVQDFLCAVRISQLSPEEQVRDFKRIMSINPMSLVLLFYAGITKLNNTGVCNHLLQVGARPPQDNSIIPSICDALSETRDSRRLFLTFLHCLYEANRDDLQPEYLTDISFTFYRLSMYNINVIFHSIADIARLSRSNGVVLSIGMCDINDHKIESAVKILIKRASSNYRQFNQCVSIGLALYANNLTHIGVRSLAKLIVADGIRLTLLDISCNLVTRQSNRFEALKILIESMSSVRGFCLPLLSMYFCGLTSRHAYHLVLLLRHNIKYLDISENQNLSECIPMLIAAVRHTESLDVRDTSVTDKEIIQVGRILQSNTSLQKLSIGFGIFDEPFQARYLTPEAICECIKLITSHSSRSKLCLLSIADCYMKNIDSNDQVQRALTNFSLRRGHPLKILKFSITHPDILIGRNFSNQVQQRSISDSLLRGKN